MRRRRPRSLDAARALALALALSLPLFTLALAGCEEPRNVPGEKRAAPAKKVEDNFIVGKRTQDIRNANVEVQQKGARAVTPRITAKDPITLSGNAYVTAIGQTSILNIKHALDLYQASNDRFPADYAEFKKEIIDANNIALPKLPYYQEYGYDEKGHKLVILEYPDRKSQP